MTDKVQKIREVIEKRYECWKEKELNSHSIESEIRMSECQHLLLMLDSLQEEPVSKEIGNYDHKAVMESLYPQLKEESVSDGKDIFDNCLKNEEKFILPQKISGNINCENCLYSSACALGDIQACIIDKPVSEDLEEAAKHCIPDESYYMIIESEEEGSGENVYDYVQMIEMFKAGAKWQKEQMIAKAIDAVVSQVPCANEIILRNPESVHWFYLPQEMDKLGVNKGDKVKVIVIKEK